MNLYIPFFFLFILDSWIHYYTIAGKFLASLKWNQRRGHLETIMHLGNLNETHRDLWFLWIMYLYAFFYLPDELIDYLYRFFGLHFYQLSYPQTKFLSQFSHTKTRPLSSVLQYPSPDHYPMNGARKNYSLQLVVKQPLMSNINWSFIAPIVEFL